MPADNLPIVCYFDIDVPDVLPFQLYIINELEFVSQETFAVFDLSDDTIEFLEDTQVISREEIFSFANKLELTDLIGSFYFIEQFKTKQELIDFILEQESMYSLIGKLSLNDFLIELAKQHSFLIKKQDDIFLEQREEEDC